jgi:hypothetical protein
VFFEGIGGAKALLEYIKIRKKCTRITFRVYNTRRIKLIDLSNEWL